LCEITARDVRKTYASPAGSVEALHVVSAQFAASSLNAVVGPSGSGKSTLLRLIAGADLVDSGSIRVGGVDVTSLRRPQLRRYRRAGVTYVDQRPTANLFPHLRLRDQFDGAPPRELLEQLGIAAQLHARPAQLSGGEQARAALAVAATRATPVLLVDEPTAELDDASAERVLEVLLQTANAGCTIVVATHDPKLAAVAGAVHDLSPHTAVTESKPPRADRACPGTALAARGLTKRYGPVHAVDDASLELSPGEIGVVLGRSGSGKSTLLMLLGGWLQRDAGEVTPTSSAWRAVGYLPQRFGLLPELSVTENVGLPLRIAGVYDDPRISQLLDALELAPLARRSPHETSIGQQQRTALARALVQQPAVLLADEPMSHQDSRSSELVWQTLLEAAENGAACLVATHDQALADRADRVWHMNEGRLTRPAAR